MKGGIIRKNLSITSKSTFYHFLDNSVCTLLTANTKGGILFKLTLDSSVESPYMLNRSNTPNADVRELIMKLVFMNENYEMYKLKNDDGSTIVSLHNTKSFEFLAERAIQTHVFKNTLDAYLEPACPSIVFESNQLFMSELFNLFESANKNGGDSKFIFEKIMATMVPPKTRAEAMSNVKVICDNKLFTVGLVVMENLSGFDTLENIDNAYPSSREFNKKLVILELFRMFNLNMLHGDFHKNNFMINPTYEYIDGQPGRAIIIDFGAAFPHQYPPVDPDNMMQVVDYYFATEIPSFPSGTVERHLFYQWLRVDINDYPAWNAELKALWDAREVKKGEFIAHVAAASAATTVGGKVKTMRSPKLYSSKTSRHVNKNTVNVFNTMFNKDHINVFNKLDPDNLFTYKFIRKYIDDELHNLSKLNTKSRKQKK